jgi:predicted outer membrane repeat protein
MLSLRTPLFLALSLSLAPAALGQTTWFVDAAAVPPGNGTPGSPYTSIQYAHDQASTLSGDTLSIAAGDYREALTFAQGKALNLVGAGVASTRLGGGLLVSFVPGTTSLADLSLVEEKVRFDRSAVSMERVVVRDVDDFSGTAVTVLEADSTWTDVTFAFNEGALYIGGPASATLTNVTFSGNGGYASSTVYGLGSTLTLVGCTFLSNHASETSGGAIYLDNSQATVDDCTFRNNVATFGGRNGGAIAVSGSTLTLSDSLFEDNYSGHGGALALLGGNCVATNVVFRDNTAQSDGAQMFHSGQGGAVWVGPGSSFTAQSCSFSSNQVLPPLGTQFPDDQLGGAIFRDLGVVNVSDSVFRHNTAVLGGSAVYGAATLVRCQVVANGSNASGSTIFGAILDQCTVADNDTATAAVVDSTVTNSIVWANASGAFGGQVGGDLIHVTYSCIQWGAAGLGNINGDPQFADLAGGDVSLTLGSPCIDAANPSQPLDADLTPADMGALPFTWQPIGAAYCSTNPNSSGQTAQIAALGSASVADDFLRVQATQTAVNQLGLFLMSQNQGFVPFFNGSQGNLCVSAPIFRLTNTPGSVSSSGAQGLLNLRVGLTTLPAGLQILPGQTWHFQSWFRDNVGGNSTSNTSDAVSVTFQ